MPDHQQTARTRLWGTGWSAAFLISVSVAAIAPASALADKFASVGSGWQRYSNDLYGTEFEFPADLFTVALAPAAGDGRRFISHDATLEIFAWGNSESETARTLKGRLLEQEGYEVVTYAPAGENWLVLSGFRGGDIFYEKYLLRDGVIHAFGLEFPASAKPIYAPVVERIEDSFRAGAPSSAALARGPSSPQLAPTPGGILGEERDPLVVY